MALIIGEINKLEVKRETDIAYTLTDGIVSVFLHFNQTKNKLRVGDRVNAFLYFDQKKRLCATLETPKITTKKFDFVEVVDKNSAGVFVNIGIAKDILLSSDYLPNDSRFWPLPGEIVPCILKEKVDQLVARIINKEDNVKAKSTLEVGRKVDAIVTMTSSDGMRLYTQDYCCIFVHQSMMRKRYRIGEVVTVNIVNINKAGEYNGSLIEQKEIMRLSDADTILNHLRTLGGAIELGNSSTPEEISRMFKMSKSAFKRALGNLYKQKLIVIEDHRPILVEENK